MLYLIMKVNVKPIGADCQATGRNIEQMAGAMIF